MSFNIKVNNFRRTVMRALASGVGGDEVMKGNVEMRRVLVCRPNSRLGNQLMITPLTQEIVRLYPHCKIDLFVRGNLSEILFEKYGNVDRIIKLPKKPFKQLLRYIGVWCSLRKYKYDMVVNVDGGSASGRLATRWVRADYRLFGDVRDSLAAQYSDYEHMAKRPVYNIRYLINQDLLDQPIPTLNISLSADELENGKKVLNSIVDGDKKTIGIYTFATGQKCFSKDFWAQIHNRLMLEYGDTYNIMEILPIENVSQIDFAAPSYYSKDIREIASVMANTSLFLGADSGMMHLASATQTPTIGLFSVTSVNRYQPYNKGSVAIDSTKMSVAGIMRAIARAL